MCPLQRQTPPPAARHIVARLRMQRVIVKSAVAYGAGFRAAACIYRATCKGAPARAARPGPRARAARGSRRPAGAAGATGAARRPAPRWAAPTAAPGTAPAPATAWPPPRSAQSASALQVLVCILEEVKHIDDEWHQERRQRQPRRGASALGPKCVGPECFIKSRSTMGIR